MAFCPGLSILWDEEPVPLSHSYDQSGNRTKLVEHRVSTDGNSPPDKVTAYQYNNANQLVAEDSKATGKITYTYDANGNLIKKSGKKLAQTYEYTVENRLKAVQNEGVLLLAVTYDGDGNRIFQISRKDYQGYANPTDPVDVGTCGDGSSIGNNGKHNGIDNGNGNKNQGNNGNHYGNTKDCDQDKGNNGNHNGSDNGNQDKGNNGNHNGSDQGNNGNNGNSNNGNSGNANGNGGGKDKSLSLSVADQEITAFAQKHSDSNQAPSTSSPSSSTTPGDTSVVFPANETMGIDKNRYIFHRGTRERDKEQVHRPKLKVIYKMKLCREKTLQGSFFLLETFLKKSALIPFVKDTYVYGNNDERLTRDHIQNDNPTESGHRALDTYLYDGRGSVSQVTNEQSIIVGNQQYRHDPFGNMIQNKPDNEIMFGYNGEKYNPITDTQYLRARYYDVGMSRFINKDTYLGDTQNPLTRNLYAYTANDPVNHKDPSGNYIVDGDGNRYYNNQRSNPNTSKSVTNISPKKSTVLSTKKSAQNNQIDTLVDNLKKLETITKDYATGYLLGIKISTPSASEINQLNLGYIRSNVPKYSDKNLEIGIMWDYTAGAIDSTHKKKIDRNHNNLATYFSEKGKVASILDPVTGKKLDLLHMFATIDGITSSPINFKHIQELSGWGGDLQTALNDLVNDTGKSKGDKCLKEASEEIIGNPDELKSHFSLSDMLADVDALNIAKMLNKSSRLLLSDAVKKYYSPSGGVHERYTLFIKNSGGIKQLEAIATSLVNSRMAPLINVKANDKQKKALVDAFISYINSKAKKEK